MDDRRSPPRRYEVLALAVLVVSVLVGFLVVGAVLRPEQSFWEHLRPGVVIAVGMLIAYPFLKKARQKQ
ncbi:hypothetical protein [Citricoccus sp.]|uniref:hypothetical protein n=1 Tax=Citricoccus sp. TaxID=1978372 RepID=UPI002616D91F|nr:hypothetical protein [Citricoccus sp.]HRO94598.1 hypothetical protein [Citricoccus sp.]